ncbi:unnamed protein product [Calypogeia fissa]
MVVASSFVWETGKGRLVTFATSRPTPRLVFARVLHKSQQPPPPTSRSKEGESKRGGRGRAPLPNGRGEGEGQRGAKRSRTNHSRGGRGVPAENTRKKVSKWERLNL